MMSRQVEARNFNNSPKLETKDGRYKEKKKKTSILQINLPNLHTSTVS